jgi:hypothetical protein
MLRLRIIAFRPLRRAIANVPTQTADPESLYLAELASMTDFSPLPAIRVHRSIASADVESVRW